MQYMNEQSNASKEIVIANRARNKKYYELHAEQKNERAKAKRDEIKKLLSQQTNNSLGSNCLKCQIGKTDQTDQTELKDQNNSIEILTVDPNEHIKIINERYISRKQIEKQIQKFADLNMKTLLIGQTGTGKSMLAKMYASKNKLPIVTIPCNKDMSQIDLLGTYAQLDKTKFVMGYIPLAITLANKFGKCVLLIDEINCLDNGTQKILNEGLHFRHGITSTKANKQFKLNDNSKVIVIATMNPSTYTGTNELNLELFKRFKPKLVNDLSEDDLRELAKDFKINTEIIEKLVQFVNRINASNKSGNLTFNIDTRLFSDFCIYYEATIQEGKTDLKALKESIENTIVNYYQQQDEKEYNLVLSEIESIFGIVIKI